MPTSEHIKASKDSFQTTEPSDPAEKIHFNEEPISGSKRTLKCKLD